MTDLPPPRDLPFHRFLLWELICSRVQMGFHSAPANHLAPADHLTMHLQIYLPLNGNLRFILLDSYSDSSGRPDGRSTIPENGDLRFILIDSYSESSDRPDGRSSGRSTPPEKKQFQIHTDRLLFWDSGRPGGRSSGRSTPQKMAIWDSYW